MKVYLVRHGESIAAGNDNERPLSEKGKADIEKLAQFILPFKIRVSRVLQSEKLRAQQTAVILLSSITTENQPQITPMLDPLASPDVMIKELYTAQRDTLLVGHMPFMGEFVAKAITDKENTNVVMFKPGSMVCLEQVVDHEWIIRWMLTPELFNS